MKPIRMMAVCCSILFLTLSAKAQQSCSQLGENYFSCGIPTEEFEYMQAISVNGGLQIQSNWCWAACVQMVLNYHGLAVNQGEVVTRIYGAEVNQPANEQQILATLTGWAPDVTTGGYSEIHAYGGYTTIQEIVNGLSLKWPLIVGLRNEGNSIGHACVMTAIYYYVQYDFWGNPVIYPERVVLRDPWPGNPSRQEIDWNTFVNRAFMGVKVWVTRG